MTALVLGVTTQENREAFWDPEKDLDTPSLEIARWLECTETTQCEGPGQVTDRTVMAVLLRVVALTVTCGQGTALHLYPGPAQG